MVNIMSARIIQFSEFRPGPDRQCWQDIASNPHKLRYWKEIAELWKKSLHVEVRRLPHNC